MSILLRRPIQINEFYHERRANYPALNIYQVDEYIHCFKVNYVKKQVKRY
jgi:hypothetical protein